MFIQKNVNHAISLLVTDSGGNIISNDTPYVCIKNQDGKFYNGIEFVDTEARLSMDSQNNGYYTASFVPGVSGRYSILAKSEVYLIQKQYYVDVYDDSMTKYPYKLGTEFSLELIPDDGMSNIMVQTQRQIDSMYLTQNGDWNNEISFINIPANAEGKYIFSFVPDIESSYILQIDGSKSDAIYIIDATVNSDSVIPVFVGSSNILAPDGSSSEVLDNFSRPIVGAKITIRSLPDTKIASVTSTDSDGKWGVYLTPGKYHFFIEKSDYISVSFIRTVI